MTRADNAPVNTANRKTCRMGITHAGPAARTTTAGPLTDTDRRIIAQARAITVRRITGHEALSAAFGEAQQVLAELAAIIDRLSGEDDHG
jgi:hypothetical protein